MLLSTAPGCQEIMGTRWHFYLDAASMPCTWVIFPLVYAIMLAESYKSGRPVVVFGLLSHEQKMSVVHFVVRRFHADDDEPVKSKEPLTLHVGYRRFTACPVYSQHTNMNKHKVRSCRHGCYSVPVVEQSSVVSMSVCLSDHKHIFRTTHPVSAKL